MRFAVIKGILKTLKNYYKDFGAPPISSGTYDLAALQHQTIIKYVLVFTISLQMCICDASEYIFVKVTRSYFLRLPMPS